MNVLIMTKELKEFEDVNESLFKLMEYAVYLKEAFDLKVCGYGNYDDIKILSYEECYGMVFNVNFKNLEIASWEDSPNLLKLEFKNVEMDFVNDVNTFTDKWLKKYNLVD